MDLRKEEIFGKFKTEIGFGVCKECKECSNYFVSELGCYGNSKACEYYCIH